MTDKDMIKEINRAFNKIYDANIILAKLMSELKRRENEVAFSGKEK